MKLLCLIILLPLFVFSQHDSDSVANRELKLSYKQFIVPTAFMLTGTLLRHSKANLEVKKFRDTYFGDFQTDIDDYLQYTPAALMLLGNQIGFQSVHGTKQMLVNMAVSNLLISAVVLPLKHTIRDWRPDGSTRNSFPSGHSAATASSAMLHFLEYKDDNIWYASSVFAIGTATGFMRILNNRHWLSDVLAGGGLGISTALLTFYCNPIKWNSKKSNRLTVLPAFSEQNMGFVLTYRP